MNRLLRPLSTALVLLSAPVLRGEEDPRIGWTEAEDRGDAITAVAALEAALASDAPPQDGVYWLGRLLLDLGDVDRAAAAFGRSLGSEPELAPWSSYRLAEIEEARGNPEVATGLLATLLGHRPAKTLATAAAALLEDALARGGDCRVLAGRETWRLDDSTRRLLELAAASCEDRDDKPTAARELLEVLLAEETGDGPAYEAASRLFDRFDDLSVLDGATQLAMARAFFAQRDFERALELFSLALDPERSSVELRADFELHYAIARSYFWLGDYREAAARFEALVGLARRGSDRARAHYQQARSLELGGDRAGAGAALAKVRSADPAGNWAAAALVSGIRLAWLDGDEERALDLYQTLGGRRGWRGSRARAALFLAASELSQDRSDRATEWLAAAAAPSGIHLPELRFWEGRLAEIQGDSRRAVERYLAAMVEDAYDPWSLGARRRLAEPALRAEADRRAVEFGASDRALDLVRAWLLTEHGPDRATALGRARAALSAAAETHDFLTLQPAPPAAWPLWSSPRVDVEERLLALGDWRFGLGAAPEHFPTQQPSLALARATRLAAQGLPRAGILTAEIMSRTAPATVPGVLWPQALRKALYPLAYGEHLVRETTGRGLDPRLLAGLIREESRFDAGALSAAAARGLTQFVLPTARRLGGKLGMEEVAADDLFEPEIAVRLGAAYLEELGERFGPRPHQVLAAYNAGEPQAELWRSYCFTDEPEEFLSKLGFRETRGYVRKVLRSYAVYRELYPVLPTTLAGNPISTSSK